MDSSVKYGLGVDDMDLMAELSHQIAAGIEKSRLFEQIQQLSQIDGLTGLYNHRIFQEKLRQEVNRRNRTQKPLSLIMLDIDHFKQFNDNYGHQAGDSVLKELSEIITSQSRCTTIDVCCRYGGEEFAIIMPELELHNAVKVAERLRKVVENNAFTVKEGNPDVKVTISLGAAGVTGADDLSPEELVKKADDALYLSKKNGRNRVSFSPMEPAL
jgi:diguanylate cyclase (GGDEF)-like protein